MNTQNRWRFERKYILSYAMYTKLSHLCKGFLSLDKHSNTDGSYRVKSLYLDTFSNKSHHDKVNGLHERYKLRIRTYGPAYDILNFEAKHKKGDKILKKSHDIQYAHVIEHIQQSSYGLWKPTHHSRDIDLYLSQGHFKSSVIIQYDREAYVDYTSGVRITFDKNLCCDYKNMNLFDHSAQMTPLTNPNTIILEVKYTTLPQWINRCILFDLPFPQAISKYCLGKATQLL